MEYKEHTHVRTEVWDSCTNCSVRNSASSELLPHCHLHAPVPDTQLGCVGSSGFVGGAAPDCWTNFIGDMKWSHHISCLVGGWTNPSKKYDRQIGILPQIGVKIKHIWNHPPRCESVQLYHPENPELLGCFLLGNVIARMSFNHCERFRKSSPVMRQNPGTHGGFGW